MKTTINSLLLFLLLAPVYMFGQTSLTGTVTEQSTSIPLPGVNVVIKEPIMVPQQTLMGIIVLK